MKIAIPSDENHIKSSISDKLQSSKGLIIYSTENDNYEYIDINEIIKTNNNFYPQIATYIVNNKIKGIILKELIELETEKLFKDAKIRLYKTKNNIVENIINEFFVSTEPKNI